MRERIIQTAQQMFLQYGIKRITIDDIAKHLGISKNTFYAYFTSKDDLIATKFEQDLTQAKETLQQLAHRQHEPLEHLLALINFINGQLFRYSPSFLVDIHQQYREDWNKYLHFMETVLYPHLSQVLQEGINTRVFREDINASIIAKGLVELLKIPFNSNVYSPSVYDFGQISS